MYLHSESVFNILYIEIKNKFTSDKINGTVSLKLPHKKINQCLIDINQHF